MADQEAARLPALSRRRLFLTVFPPIMLPVFLAVIDQTIVATALPAIARSLGEVERLSWVVVSYLVANTIAAPVYGRLADLFGRRRLMLSALGLFMAASLLCALARSIEALTAARLLQGVGGGGLMTLSQALIGESVPLHERGRFQGYLSAVIVCGGTFGPVAGGFLTQALGWPSVFLVNLPLGLLAVGLVLRLPSGTAGGGPVRFDALGLVLLAGFIAPLLLAMDRVQHFDSGAVPAVAGMAAASGVALALLLWQERRARAPLIPLRLLRRPSIWRANAMAAFSGASLVAMVTFLPIYLQVVDGASPADIGFLLLPLTAGVGIGSVATGWLVSRTGRTAVFPSVGLVFTALTLVFVALRAPALSGIELTWIIAAGAVTQGSAMPVAQILVQALAGPGMLGASAGMVQLSRSLGSALGVALVGGVLFAVLSRTDRQVAVRFAEMVQQGPRAMAALDPAHRAIMQAEIATAFRAAFLTVASFSLGILALAWTMPARRL